MKEDEFGKMLSELGRLTTEAVRPTLADDIKAHIPSRLASHRKGMHTISIIIDLRVSRLAAAGVVIITLVLLAGLLGGRNSSDGGIIQDSKLLLGYLQGNDNRQDSNSVLVYSRLPNGRYKVVFRDFRVKEVSAGELIKLQARMLQRQK